MLGFSRISSQELVDFTKNLSAMLKSGVVVNEALSSLLKQAKSKKFRQIIQKIKSEIEAGTSLSEAFGKEEKVFGQVFISLVKAGEISGTLEKNLNYLADWLERNNDLKQQVRASLLYPKIVLAAAVIIGGGLSVLVLPRLVPLFKSLRVELPLATRILMSTSLFIEQYWYWVLLGLVAFFITLFLLNKIKLVRRFFHFIFLKMPIFGHLITDFQLALVSQLASSLFSSGLVIDETLSITSTAATNVLYQESMEQIKGRVDKGVKLSEAMKGFPNLYPPNMINVIATGEKGGTLDKSFSDLSDYYTKEVNNKVKKLPTTIEPVLLIVIGLIIAFIAISIIMPIYELTQGIEQQIQ